MELNGHSFVMEVMENDDDTPALIGYWRLKGKTSVMGGKYTRFLRELIQIASRSFPILPMMVNIAELN